MKLYGNYAAVVIQNNDPDRAGKVKVFIPHIGPTVYQNWIQRKTNKRFKFLGNNINSILTELVTPTNGRVDSVSNIAEELKKILPWAECAAPLAGESSSGRYNNQNQVGTIVDSNFPEHLNPDITSDQLPGKPGSVFEKDQYRLNDAFTSADKNINRPNPFSYQYKPSTYSNNAKGSFCIPAVGSHVWVFFREGNPTQPVYFASSFSKDDWNGIYNAVESPGADYPGTFENKIVSDYNVNVDTYRNKYVINQKGGTLEFINSDLKETIKLTHFSGSFKEMNNQTNIELATANDQKLVLNDQYETVQGFKNEYVGKSLDIIVGRDRFVKIGKITPDLMQKWKQSYAFIHENKQLFEIKRTGNNNVVDTDGNIRVKRNSIMQTKSGTFAKHPAVHQTYKSLDNNSDITYTNTSTSSSDGPSALNVDTPTASDEVYPSPTNYISDTNKTWGEGGAGKSTSTQDGNWAVEEQKDLYKTIVDLTMQELVDIEKDLGVGGSEIVQIAKHKIETIGQTINDLGSIRYDPIGKMINSNVRVDEYGTFVDKTESPLIEMVHVQDLPGGTYTLNICNRYNVMVGAGGAFIKTLGSLNISGAVTNITGQQVNVASDNEINISSKTLNITAEILRIRNKKGKQIIIEDNLGVVNNITTGGGIHVEGETFIQHVTAPKEYQVTEQTILFSKLLTGLQFTCTINGNPATIVLTGDSNDNLVRSYPHSHVFANIPLTLVDTNKDLRKAAKVLNSDTRSIASQRDHSKK